MSDMRLQKFLSKAGICSRRKGEEYIQCGFVKVNGESVTEPGIKVDPDHDIISFKGKNIHMKNELVYIILNKPEGYITSLKHGNEKIVTDLIDYPVRLNPVGRLDKNSEGLLIMTNDGDLHHKLTHPSYNHEKEYEVRVKSKISDKELKKMSEGVVLDGRKTRTSEIVRTSPSSYKIVLKEGRNRQIRRMAEIAGNKVTRLKRVRISNILLSDLKKGSWRHLNKNEIKKLTDSIK